MEASTQITPVTGQQESGLSANAIKRKILEYTLAEGFNLLAKHSDRNYTRLCWLLEKVVDGPEGQVAVEWLKDYVSPGHQGAAYFNRVLGNLHPNVRRKYLARFVTSILIRDPYTSQLQEEAKQRTGANPKLLVISPSMRCNLRCVGCYAGMYNQREELPEALVQRVIDEAKALGVRFFVISGGEPFVYKPLLRLLANNPDCAFQIYTNGTMIDQAMARKLVQLGNACPCISIEGWKEDTDWRRGAGMWDKVSAAMDNLREAGGIFGFSATATSKNYKIITSDDFIDEMIKRGCAYGWYFMYIPTGLNPDMSLFLTPEQRSEFRELVRQVRSRKPILAGDFWNDGCLTDGCLAGGRHYLHVTASGEVEPCVFAHFAVDNIKEKSLVDIINSDFFKSIRNRAPYHENLLTPCAIIDHPEVLRDSVFKHGAHPTHEGADSIVTTLAAELDAYSRHQLEVSTPVFETQYKPWADHFHGRDRAKEEEKEEEVGAAAG